MGERKVKLGEVRTLPIAQSDSEQPMGLQGGKKALSNALYFNLQQMIPDARKSYLECLHWGSLADRRKAANGPESHS